MGLRKRDVYPQYYRAKRRRERIAIGASIVVSVVIITALLALAIAYFIRPREGLDELAQRRDEIVAPTVEELGREFAGQALMAKLDVDANPATARRYGVMSIPTLLFFHNGQEVDRAVGVQPADVLRHKLEAMV